jgi:hypothetical protein
MPLYASFNDVLSLCMIMAVIALLVGEGAGNILGIGRNKSQTC